MRGRTLVVYILIFICIAAYYYYFEIYRVAAIDPGTTRGEESAVAGLNASKVEEITIAGSGSVTVSRRGSSWRITAPVDIPADPQETEDLLAAIINLKIQRKLENTPSLADLGLDPPRLIMNLRTDKGEYFIHIGNPTPTKQYCYAKSGSHTGVFLVYTHEVSSLDRDVLALREKHVFVSAYEDITRLRIRRHGLILEFLKDSGGLWRLLQDQSVKLKNEKINELLSRLCRTQARAFPEEITVSGDPDIIIELFREDGSEILRIWLSQHVGENVCAYSDALGQHVELHNSLIPLIPHSSFDVMDRSLVMLDAVKVDRIVLAGEEKRVFTRKGGVWFSGEKRIEDPSVVESFLVTMGSLEYVDEYMMLPEDVQIKRSFQISCQESSCAFDIALCSKYYVALGDKCYQINEGSMKMINDSFDMLMKCCLE